ncbi:hypothetical protein PR202_ga17840 [Eleusine coracana subsp. coracana]|uniref:Uncharacterized protein n=1 Tax=Eleusine coracana subsp. coracana TaxID=191504 RepID=A0AAV5CPY1_ELECO|nr:hypothetical protein PR202_ga17840 [Eleusine coracana subsp. coracana]
MRAILEPFAQASGLHTNVQKCQITPIRCNEDELTSIQSFFPCQLKHFPCTYLGVPLSIKKLTKAQLQPLVDRVGDYLPTWKSRLLNRAGRAALTKVTLSAVPIHLSISVGLPPWTIKAIDKFRKGFIWTGTCAVSNGKCLVAWRKACRPSDMGGLGILDLTLLGYALRLRWEWLRRTDTSRTWVALPSTAEHIIKQFFSIFVHVQIGDGSKALFWRDHWLDGKSLQQLAPEVFRAVPTKIRNTRTVQDALHNQTWITDIKGSRTVPLIREFLQLLDRIDPVQTSPGTQDNFIWRWSSSGKYTSSSAYRAFFIGQYNISGAKELCKTGAPRRQNFSIG